ncbi:hypothetical protein [Kitasatospora sp. NPDC096204]|uniref:hypothetical protein n=1 Tax=Kitasatospora sp. NPDC096204 TaxID=3364094 RepID=UPI0037FB4F5E
MDELPLWGGELIIEQPTGRSTGRPAAEGADLPDLRAQLCELAEAWEEVAPEELDASDDLRAVLEADVEALQARWQHVAGLPDASEAVAAGLTGHSGARGGAAAVNAALREVDRDDLALRGVPEWQQLRAVRDAVARVWQTLVARAGEAAGRLLGDRRVAEFLRTMSIRACETITRLARLAADRLRGGRAPENAEALLALGRAASAYGRSARLSGEPAAAEALLVLGAGPREDPAWHAV